MNKHIRFAVMNLLENEFVAIPGDYGFSFTENLYEAQLMKTNTEAELFRTDVIDAFDQYNPNLFEVVRINPDIRRVTRGRPSKK